jgi:hypothetical protein
MSNEKSGLAIDLKGVIYKINDTQQISETFKKREFILECSEANNSTGEIYKQYLPIEVIKDNCSKLDNFKAGEAVEVSINLRGRLWGGDKEKGERAFLNLLAWRIYRHIEEAAEPEIVNEIEGGEDINTGPDDLPF